MMRVFFFAQHKVTSTVRSPGRTKQIQRKERGEFAADPAAAAAATASTESADKERGSIGRLPVVTKGFPIRSRSLI